MTYKWYCKKKKIKKYQQLIIIKDFKHNNY
jgi:hypothetical protein